MMIKILSVLLGVFLGASLLSGSSISCPSWYSAPPELSNLLISIIVPLSIMLFMKKILNFIFCSKK